MLFLAGAAATERTGFRRRGRLLGPPVAATQPGSGRPSRSARRWTRRVIIAEAGKTVDRNPRPRREKGEQRSHAERQRSRRRRSRTICSSSSPVPAKARACRSPSCAPRSPIYLLSFAFDDAMACWRAEDLRPAGDRDQRASPSPARRRAQWRSFRQQRSWSLSGSQGIRQGDRSGSALIDWSRDRPHRKTTFFHHDAGYHAGRFPA